MVHLQWNTDYVNITTHILAILKVLSANQAMSLTQ